MIKVKNGMKMSHKVKKINKEIDIVKKKQVEASRLK